MYTSVYLRIPLYPCVYQCMLVYACIYLCILVYTRVHTVYPCVYTCVYLRIPAYSEFSWPFEFPYPVHGKFMVGFSIKFNGKTNHKLPVTGYGKFERPRNSLYTCVHMHIPVYPCISLCIPAPVHTRCIPAYTCVFLCTPGVCQCSPCV